MKPKCDFCNKKGDENFYWWWKDKLVHYSCALKAKETLEKVMDGLAKLENEISNS